MHLSECFDLALPHSTECAADENGNESGCLSTDSSLGPLQQLRTELLPGSIHAVLQCIALDWGTKLCTNFYVPDNYSTSAAGAFSPSGSHKFHLHYLPQPSFYAPMTVPYVHPRLNAPVPPLHLPKYFGALCLSFSLGGAVMLWWPPKWVLCGGGRARGRRAGYHRHPFPYRSFAFILMLVQGPCSFLADYIHMTNISIWHAIDRFLACILMVFELAKLIVMRPYTRPLVYLAYLGCCGGAVFCFRESQASQETLDAQGFVFWHSGWHCYAVFATLVRTVEIYLNKNWGEYYNFDHAVERETEKCGSKRGGRSVILLSTIAMNYRDDAEEKTR